MRLIVSPPLNSPHPGQSVLLPVPDFIILYDEPHEAAWFQALNPILTNAAQIPITIARQMPSVRQVLAYDRPDIVLLDGETPILVVEETVEVPSGHNVGQRFARIAAAAECGVPCLYFGPYVAKKHGGATAGPRYMNVRLFHAIDAMVRATSTAITTINWPVDSSYEIRRDPAKDGDVREYIATFLDAYRVSDLRGVSAAMLASKIQTRMIKERDEFVATVLSNPERYDGPPNSVETLTRVEFVRRHGELPLTSQEVVLYKIGMTKIRSDPYTGMAMLYKYLYIVGQPSRALVLWFPFISSTQWRAATGGGGRKDIRLFRIVADAVLFSDVLIPRVGL
jgi:hypothetical protein